MQDELCELRFDIPLSALDGPRQFERGWRDVLAAQRLTALALPPAQTVAARFRLCGTTPPAEQEDALGRYLPARLAALPGTPRVSAEAPLASPDWQGVKIWLSYRAPELNALLQQSHSSRRKTTPTRGRRR